MSSRWASGWLQAGFRESSQPNPRQATVQPLTVVSASRAGRFAFFPLASHRLNEKGGFLYPRQSNAIYISQPPEQGGGAGFHRPDDDKIGQLPTSLGITHPLRLLACLTQLYPPTDPIHGQDHRPSGR